MRKDTHLDLKRLRSTQQRRISHGIDRDGSTRNRRRQLLVPAHEQERDVGKQGHPIIIKQGRRQIYRIALHWIVERQKQMHGWIHVWMHVFRITHTRARAHTEAAATSAFPLPSAHV